MAASQSKEAIRLIRKELGDLRTLLESALDNVKGMQVALGEFIHDSEGRDQRQDAELQTLRGRVKEVEKRVGIAR